MKKPELEASAKSVQTPPSVDNPKNATAVAPPAYGVDLVDLDASRGSAEKNQEETPIRSAEDAKNEEKKLSPVREALMKQFKAFDQAKVGDKQFDQVITQKAWDETKLDEANQQEINNAQFEIDVKTFDARVRQYEQDLKDYPAKKKQYDMDLASWWSSVQAWEKAGSKGPRPVKPPEPKQPRKPILPKAPAKAAIFTTCIATQGKVLSNALEEIGHDLKKIEGNITHPAFASDGKERAQKLGAWKDASPKMPERPQTGDILVYSMRGYEVDAAEDAVTYAKGSFSEQAQSVARLEKQLAMLKERMAGLEGPKLETAQAESEELDAKLSAAKERYAAYIKKLEDKLEEKRTFMQANTDKLWFSHVGFFVSRTVRPKDPNAKGELPLETWETFDGGQKVAATTGDKKGEMIEGAKFCRRIYDPNTNQISGEAQQGGKVRWLKGWTNVDALVGDAKKAK